MSNDVADDAATIDGAVLRTALVNGVAVSFDALPAAVLSEALREELGLTGTKVGCSAGDCGACTVMIDRAAVCACMVPVGRLAGTSITTVEGLIGDELGERLQASFLRHAAAQCGFCTPGMLMAARALLGTDRQPTRQQVMDGLGGVLCRCTGYQAIIAAVLDVDAADPVTVRPTSGKAVGASIERVDGRVKVAGTDVFGDDDAPDDALVIHIIRSPFARAAFTFCDLESFVSENDGITAVLTARDVPGVNRFGVIAALADQPVFAEHETRFAGEAVAAVVVLPGFDFSSIEFPVVWAALNPLTSPALALHPAAELVHTDRPANVLVEGFVQTGDVDAVMPSCAVVASAEFDSPFVEHAYIEPEAGWAEVIDGLVVIHVTTQSAYMDRASMAEILGVADHHVRIVPTAVGGGFGGKLDLSVQPFLALAALRTGQPVRITYSRAESMASTTKRHPSQLSVSIGADTNGKVTAMSFEGVFDTGAYASWGPTVANRVPIHASGPYFIPNYHAHSTAVHTNGPPSGAFRGFGVPQAAIAQETLFDELAGQLGIDRLEFRILNALTAGQRTVTGHVLEGGVGIRDCLEALRDPWADALTRADSLNRANDSRYRRGVGVAGIWYGCGNTSLSNPSTIKVGVRRDGSVVLHQGAIDIGQGSNTVISQIVADAIGIEVHRLQLRSADTSITPDAGKTSASRQTYVSGMAAYLAGASLRAGLLAMLDASFDSELVFDAGALSCQSNGVARSVDLRRLPVDADGFVAVAVESYDPPTTALDHNGQGKPYAVFGYGTQLVELSVDTATGRVELHRVVAAYDVGKAINPQLVVGQIEGGIAQGIGLALLEEYLPGRTNNLHDYLIPTIGDVPPIETIIVETHDPVGPYGAKGVGEHSLIPTAPAILNAIHHACGIRIRSVPATPTKVLAALRKRGAA